MKKLHKLKVFACLLLVVGLSSCERTAEVSPATIGWDYYPLQLGQYHLYDVYRINYNFSGPNDTLHYQLKETVADYYLNQDQDTVFLLSRQHRLYPEASWQLDSTYLIQRTPQRLIQTVNNRPQIQLVFPVVAGRTWDANMLNTAPADSFSIAALGENLQVQEQEYGEVLWVEQERLEDTIVKRDIREEAYAKGVGLVYKLVDIQNYCTQGCAPGTINSGLFLEMNLLETGME